MTDADVDGAHIRTLLVDVLFPPDDADDRKGYIYIAQPPLYKVKKGKKEMYVDTEEKMDEWLLSEGLEHADVLNLAKGGGTKMEPPSSRGLQSHGGVGIPSQTPAQEGRGMGGFLAFREKGEFPLYRVEEEDRSPLSFTRKRSETLAGQFH
jgi:DNA gyrase subunit B